MNLGYIFTHLKRRVSQCNGNSIDIRNPKNFSDLHGILIVDWLSTGMTINSDGYCETLKKDLGAESSSNVRENGQAKPCHSTTQ